MPNLTRDPADASPRVGSVHRRRQCGRCGTTTLVTLMKLAPGARYNIFYGTLARNADRTINAWLCHACTQYLHGYGDLRA